MNLWTGAKATRGIGLEETRLSILDVHAQLQRTDDRLATLPGLEETLARYQESGLEDRLLERSLLVSEERVLDTIPERLESFREHLDALRQDLPIDRAFLSAKALDGLPGKEILDDANPVIERLSGEVERAAAIIEEALARADEGIGDIRNRWTERQRKVESRYQQILRELQESDVDGEEFIRLRRQIEELRPLRERRTLLESLERESSQRRTALLNEWEEVKAAEFRLLNVAAQRVTWGTLRDRVQIRVTPSGNRDALYKLLRDEIGGRLSETIDNSRNRLISHSLNSSSIAIMARRRFKTPTRFRLGRLNASPPHPPKPL